MQTIVVAASVAKGWYQEHCVLHGHKAGVLSGAELQGKAAKWGSRYAASRDNLCARVLRETGVVSELLLHPESKRFCRVWNKDGKPVRLKFAEAQ